MGSGRARRRSGGQGPATLRRPELLDRRSPDDALRGRGRRPFPARGDHRAPQRGEEGRAVRDREGDGGAGRRRSRDPLGAPARPRRAPGGHLRRRGAAFDDPPRHDGPRVVRRRCPAGAREAAGAPSGPDGWPGHPDLVEDSPMPTEAAELVFDEATKVYPGREGAAVDHLSLTVPAGEICVLVGPSGGGKTTALKLVNRLIPLTGGDIRIDGRSILQHDLTELRRSIGYVIQQVGLFPHMTVEGNIGTVPRLLGWPRSRIRERVAELLELVGLDPDKDRRRFPAELSGGQRQRVGLARALAANPALMLMDEPFGAIDPIVRARLQDEFLRLQREIRKTVVFVTHDVDEAIKVGDRIAILRQGGRLAQYDTPQKILEDPIDDFVADFVGRDRALKALALRTLGELELSPAPGDGLPRLPAETSLRDALALLIAERRDALVVVGGDGSALGVVRREDLLA